MVGPAPGPASGPTRRPPTCPAPARRNGTASPRCSSWRPRARSSISTPSRGSGRSAADFFIDGVELEWCFRAWSLGYGCYLARAVAIPHRVGGGTIRAFGITMPRQPLFRMATYLRNAIYAWRLPHVPLRWKLAQAAYLPLQAGLYWADSGWRPAVLLRLLAAARDGALGRLGPPRDLARDPHQDPP
ncbi:hypothetical protein ACU4GR_04875 [Methylobacterium oryzae CBMB20]